MLLFIQPKKISSFRDLVLSHIQSLAIDDFQVRITLILYITCSTQDMYFLYLSNYYIYYTSACLSAKHALR